VDGARESLGAALSALAAFLTGRRVCCEHMVTSHVSCLHCGDNAGRTQYPQRDCAHGHCGLAACRAALECGEGH
jgi:hypothetical protein